MSRINKPYSESCDQNKDPILEIIQPRLQDCRSVLEIGSGTGQHAVYFASKLPHLVWHTSDQRDYLPGIRCWLEDANLQNLEAPIELNVSSSAWPQMQVDAVFTANTCHIMHDEDVAAMFQGVGQILGDRGKLFVYGPFNYHGDYTSDSNRRFDDWLHARDSRSGIKHFEELDRLAVSAGLSLQEDLAMPANNRILYWQKT